ncbi:DsbA family protein [Loktanella sp. D2R18]|uniref:DsbA family protein n=2 Tax=Rhodobacterales TaxID=204455 RepID=UPI000DE9C935|nr:MULTISPECIES: DsbA family protein [Rhodobacterales]MDO6590576.1 DsbA family protein [Yoonia sp. 1_MG-2023]RBW44904.1 DsbA family protein [Loktanella sp. D2R18]
MSLRYALPFLFALTSPLAALELEAMTDAERAAFRAEVRAYLLEDPEVLQEAISVLQERQQLAEVANDQLLAATYADKLFNDRHSYVGGNPTGDITIVEFMDYRCGYCKRAFPEIEALLATDANIRFIVKEYPILGEQSVLASRFAIATQLVAGDDAYKSVHDTLMEFNGNITQASMTRLAEILGLDAEAIIAQMDSEEVSNVIAANRTLGEQMQISGTPTFVVEDQMLRGYVPVDVMETIVADLRDE